MDDLKREMWSCNFTAYARAPVDKWEEEILRLITDASLGTFGTDTFIGPDAPIPNGDGPYTTINDTGGSEPDETHDAMEYERLSVQIVVRGKNYVTTRTRALAIWRAIKNTRNTTITAT